MIVGWWAVAVVLIPDILSLIGVSAAGDFWILVMQTPRIDFHYLREHLEFTHARLREATQAGDWPQAQRLLEELEEILRRLEMIIRGS